MDTRNVGSEIAAPADTRIAFRILDRPRFRGDPGQEPTVIPLREHRSGPSCSDAGCPMRNVQMRAYATIAGEEAARSTIRDGRDGPDGFTPSNPVRMTAATVKIDGDRLMEIDWLEGRAMSDPSHALSDSTYRHVMREVVNAGCDGAIAPGDLPDEYLLFIRTDAIGDTVSIEDERIELIEPLRTKQERRSGRRLAVDGAKWLAPKLIGPLVTALTAWAIKHLPELFR